MIHIPTTIETLFAHRLVPAAAPRRTPRRQPRPALSRPCPIARAAALEVLG